MYQRTGGATTYISGAPASVCLLGEASRRLRYCSRTLSEPIPDSLRGKLAGTPLWDGNVRARASGGARATSPGIIA